MRKSDLYRNPRSIFFGEGDVEQDRRICVMGFDDYSKACRLGKKDYQARMMRGEKPTLAVLDDIMPDSRYYEEIGRAHV